MRVRVRVRVRAVRERERVWRGALHRAELLPQAVAVLGRLAAALPQVGHHGVRSVAAERHGASSPGAEQSLRVERSEPRSAWLGLGLG